jgi:hypothetical protein
LKIKTMLMPFVALFGIACEAGPTETSPRVSVSVAPLELSGVADAIWDVEVVNGASTPAVVWQRRITSSRFGDQAGAVSYVGPCDGATGVEQNTVRLWLVGVYAEPVSQPGVFAAGAVGGAVGDAVSFSNPTTPASPLVRTVTCAPNTDALARFDVTIARPAQQGFFDVAVAFEDIFCSAKLDCLDEDGTDLLLLHHPTTGVRSQTAVLGFACTAAPNGSTYLYLDRPTIACAGQAPNEVIVDVAGLGEVDLGLAPSANPGGYLFGAAVYRGLLSQGGIAYWNVALGLETSRFASLGRCVLNGRATATDGALSETAQGYVLPADATYPYVAWSVELSTAAGRTCARHELDGEGPEVATRYRLPSGAPVSFDYQFDPGSGLVSSPVPDVSITFEASGSGRNGVVQTWTVPVSGTYRIDARGAQGGGPRGDGGRGARIAGDFQLAAGAVLSVGVGQRGGDTVPAQQSGNDPMDNSGGGGGGAFFVALAGSPLVVAGGGGGASYGLTAGLPGLATTTGGHTKNLGGGVNGSGGGNGVDPYGASGGGGWLSAGQAHPNTADVTVMGTGGAALSTAALGGLGNQISIGASADGGFGGGGGSRRSSAFVRGGGGGGYSGGQGAANTPASGGGGGGSFNAGTNPFAESGAQVGDGRVVIELVAP